MEVLSFVAMESPDSFEAEAVRAEKLKLWRSVGEIQVKTLFEAGTVPAALTVSMSSAIARKIASIPIPRQRPTLRFASRSRTGGEQAFRSIYAPASG
jgi:Glucose-6-phosphate dehydrogenase, C-terminal domain